MQQTSTVDQDSDDAGSASTVPRRPIRPYARLWHDLGDQLGDLWDDLAVVGAHTKLLVYADAAWPLEPELPRWLPDDLLDRLVAQGAVVRVGTTRYAVTALAAERSGRAKGGVKRAELADQHWARNRETGRFERLPPQQTAPAPTQHDPARPSNDPAADDQPEASKNMLDQLRDANETRRNETNETRRSELATADGSEVAGEQEATALRSPSEGSLPPSSMVASETISIELRLDADGVDR